jgi:anti-sigma-K factor RskA
MSDHDELESSVAAWVLGALDPEEAEAVRSHVEACPTCRELAARLRRVVGALPLAADEATPPPRLRDRVLAGAAATRSPSVVPPARRPSPRVRAPHAVRRMPAFALAAVAVLALLVGVVIGQVAHTPQPAPTQVARFSLSGHQEMAGAQASVIDLRSDGIALVDFHGLPQPGAGRVYEVWLIPGSGSPVPVAVFVPDSGGARTVVVDRSLSGYTVMAVTNEPGPDGSPAPTQQPQLYGNVA